MNFELAVLSTQTHKLYGSVKWSILFLFDIVNEHAKCNLFLTQRFTTRPVWIKWFVKICSLGYQLNPFIAIAWVLFWSLSMQLFSFTRNLRQFQKFLNSQSHIPTNTNLRECTNMWFTTTDIETDSAWMFYLLQHVCGQCYFTVYPVYTVYTIHCAFSYLSNYLITIRYKFARKFFSISYWENGFNILNSTENQKCQWNYWFDFIAKSKVFLFLPMKR